MTGAPDTQEQLGVTHGAKLYQINLPGRLRGPAPPPRPLQGSPAFSGEAAWAAGDGGLCRAEGASPPGGRLGIGCRAAARRVNPRIRTSRETRAGRSRREPSHTWETVSLPRLGIARCHLSFPRFLLRGDYTQPGAPRGLHSPGCGKNTSNSFRYKSFYPQAIRWLVSGLLLFIVWDYFFYYRETAQRRGDELALDPKPPWFELSF